MTAERKHVHTTRVPIRCADTDAQGHVNGTAYFRYMEQARIERLIWLGDRCGGLAGRGSVIVDASCTFNAPITYPGTGEVHMFLDPPNRSSIGTRCELHVGATRHAEGSAKRVCIDQRSLRSAPLPERVAGLVTNGEAVREQ